MPSLTSPRRAAAFLALALAGAADAASLLVNGGFETGDLSGWTAASQAGGNFGGFFIDGAAGYTPLTYQPSAGPAAENKARTATDPRRRYHMLSLPTGERRLPRSAGPLKGRVPRMAGFRGFPGAFEAYAGCLAEPAAFLGFR